MTEENKGGWRVVHSDPLAHQQSDEPYIGNPTFEAQTEVDARVDGWSGEDFQGMAKFLLSKFAEVNNNPIREYFNNEKHRFEKTKFDSPTVNTFPIDQTWKASAYHRQNVMDMLLPVAINRHHINKIKDLESFQTNTGLDLDAMVKASDFLEPDGIYLWTEEAFKTATAMPLPKHDITKELLALPNMFFVFEKPLVWEYPNMDERRAKRFTTFMAISSKRDEDKITFTYDSRNWWLEALQNMRDGSPTQEQEKAIVDKYQADSYQVSFDVHRNVFPSNGTMNRDFNEAHTLEDHSMEKMGSLDNLVTQNEGIRPNGEFFTNHPKEIMDGNIIGDGWIRFNSVYPDFLDTEPIIDSRTPNTFPDEVNSSGVTENIAPNTYYSEDAKVFRGGFTEIPKETEVYDYSDIVVHLLNFLQSTATDVVPTKNARRIRRQFDGEPTAETDSINVVNLRRVKYQGAYVPMGDGTGKSVEFKGSWWVTGHYRNQRHGVGRSKTKVIWIQPFMKGQGELMERVNKVRR